MISAAGVAGGIFAAGLGRDEEALWHGGGWGSGNGSPWGW